MSSPQVTANQSCAHSSHLFLDPLCENQSLLQRIVNVAFHILTLGIPLAIYHVMSCCYSRTASTQENGNIQATAVNSVQQALSTPSAPLIDVIIPPSVKQTLDQLFANSPYAIDTLPIYPIILNQADHGAPQREEMTAPVMKGRTGDGRPFIAIKVDCDLTDENIEKAGLYEKLHNHFKTHRHLEKVLVLYQYHENGPAYWGGQGEFIWDQLGGQSMHPKFFTGNFTYPDDGTGPTDSQTDNFKRVQTLLGTGQSEDTQGLIWRIPTE